MDAVNWRDQANCKNEDPEIFFRHSSEEEARQICGQCQVREECRAYALETRQPDGIWGGLNTQERNALLRKAATTAGDTPVDVVTYTTRARSTGAICSAGRTATGWGVICLTHNSLASAQNRTVAENAVSRPQEWCHECNAIAQGLAPKVEKG